MDSFLQKFSLQNLLRQFFCGVVFFVPFAIYSPDLVNAYMSENSSISAQLAKDSLSFQIGMGTWQTSKLIALSVVSALIGTVIYHLEKNLYSYIIQGFFEQIFGKAVKGKDVHRCFWLVIIWMIFIAAVLFVLLERGDFTIYGSLVIACLLILSYVFGIAFISDSIKRVISRTQQCWIVEEYSTEKTEPNLLEDKKNQCKRFKFAQCIAKKLAVWSDYIHCVQSCCLAWILGSCAVNSLESSCDISFGVTVALFILCVEFLIDFHRYHHVIAMTDGDFCIPSSFPNSK